MKRMLVTAAALAALSMPAMAQTTIVTTERISPPLSIAPEQAASWAYPQPDMSDEEIAHTLCTGLLGRLYLSGHLDRMRPAQRQAVRDAVRAYHAIRDDLADAVPEWPLGLPGRDDGWLALALRTPAATYLGLWRRPGAPPTITLPITADGIELLFPTHLPVWEVRPAQGLTVTSTSREPYSARIFRIDTSKGQK